MIGRRGFIGRVSVTVTALLLGRAPQQAAAAPATLPVYVLNPEWGTAAACLPNPHTASHSCHACTACHKHAANKLFATAAAANAGRAHPFCKCAVVQKSLLAGIWTALFGPDVKRRSSVDKRDPLVGRLLRQHPEQ